MALARPLVTVYDKDNKETGTVAMPSVMQTPIRPDLVNFVHYNIMRNHRQAFGVKENAGYQTSAESWGTGRAVSRIPRVPGGGTHRAGQGAFGNMCRGGGMFSPIKVWRRWHRRVNITQKRHAITSAIAGSGYAGLVMGKGHRIDNVSQIPLVLNDEIQKLTKTKQAIAMLESIGCGDDLKKVVDSEKLRAGRGKCRNRRYVKRRGPLIVYTKDEGLSHACINIPGVDTANVERLNLLQLAPGGTIGRLIIWTESSFKRLQEIYGDYTNGGSPNGIKINYSQHRGVMTNHDLNRIINSNEIQSVLKKAIKDNLKSPKNRNILKHRSLRCKIDPSYKFKIK